jgi:hypothetical protein
MIPVQTLTLLVPMIAGLMLAEVAASWYLRLRRRRPW